MDDATIQEAIARLDQEVPREGARVKLDQYGGGPDESRIIANKVGFLRFGLELLKAAYAPTDKGSDSVNVDIDDLITPDSTIGFDWFERRTPDEEPPSSSGRLAAAVGLSVLAVVLALVLIGLIVVVRWLFG